MLRKIILVSSFCICTGSLANGFYVGAGIGPQSADFYQDARVIVQPPGSPTITENIKDTTHFSGTGIFGSLFGGYAWIKQQFYLAGEINANISSLKFKSQNLEFVHASFAHTTYEVPQSFGLSILPGYLYTPTTLFYARLGYTNGNFKISTTDSSLANINRSLNGFRYGLGIKQSFSQHISGRMEFSQINYQTTQFTVIDGAATKTTKITPQTSQVEFGLIYDFA